MFVPLKLFIPTAWNEWCLCYFIRHMHFCDQFSWVTNWCLLEKYFIEVEISYFYQQCFHIHTVQWGIRKLLQHMTSNRNSISNDWITDYWNHSSMLLSNGKFLVPFKKTLTTRCKGACTNFSSSRKGRPYGRFTLRDEFGRKTEP